jgi:hypothetical protein
MNNPNSFFHLTHLPKIPYSYVEEAENLAVYKNDYQPPAGVISPFNMADSSFSNTKFFQNLKENFGLVYCYYIKIEPNIFHDWHYDYNRNCSINFLLTDCESLTLFEKDKTDPSNIVFEVCNYNLYYPTVLKNSTPHCIINYSQKKRYLLSISFPKQHVFDDVKEFMLSYTTDNY